MVTSSRPETAVVGGGIFGLATARRFLLDRPGSAVPVVEKEHAVGRHNAAAALGYPERRRFVARHPVAAGCGLCAQALRRAERAFAAARQAWVIASLLLGCTGSGDLAPPATPPPDIGTRPMAGCRDGTISGSAALYRICFPATWNGEMVLYAHGYIPSFWPLLVPDDDIGGLKISDLAMSSGYGYAVTSYRANGVVVPDAAQDLLELDAEVRRVYKPDPARTWLIGASLGALVATLDFEQHAERFTGALAVCGPIGDFQRLVNHLGDFRAVFDYYFPGVLPGTPIDVPDSLSQQWAARFSPIVRAAIAANPLNALQVLSVSGTPRGTTAATDVATIDELLQLHSSFLPDAQKQSGGQPYDNRATVYHGSADDTRLNADIPRYNADAAGRAGVAAFQTTGVISGPMVVLHTTGDPIVPIVQESLYTAKAAQAQRAEHLRALEVERYGHCEFSAGEMQAGFHALVEAAK